MPDPSRIAVIVNRGIASVFVESEGNRDVFEALHPANALELEWDDPHMLIAVTGRIVPGNVTVLDGERARLLAERIRGIPPRAAADAAAEFIREGETT